MGNSSVLNYNSRLWASQRGRGLWKLFHSGRHGARHEVKRKGVRESVKTRWRDFMLGVNYKKWEIDGEDVREGRQGTRQEGGMPVRYQSTTKGWLYRVRYRGPQMKVDGWKS